MKLVSLNIWGGKVFGPLMDFIKESSRDTDIFCFQEVFKSSHHPEFSHGYKINILADLTAALGGYRLFFESVQEGFDNVGKVDFEISYGQAIFVKENLSADFSQPVLICGERNSVVAGNISTMPAGMLCTRVKAKDGLYTVCNIHGFSYPGTKLDTLERLEQSRRIKRFLDKETGAKILCGDFNLMPDTESMKMLEGDLVNLIKEFKISKTRSRISPFFGTPDEQKFADYCLVSPDVKVKSFQVPDLEISDHLPMILEFE